MTQNLRDPGRDASMFSGGCYPPPGGVSRVHRHIMAVWVSPSERSSCCVTRSPDGVHWDLMLDRGQLWPHGSSRRTRLPPLEARPAAPCRPADCPTTGEPTWNTKVRSAAIGERLSRSIGELTFCWTRHPSQWTVELARHRALRPVPASGQPARLGFLAFQRVSG